MGAWWSRALRTRRAWFNGTHLGPVAQIQGGFGKHTIWTWLRKKKKKTASPGLTSQKASKVTDKLFHSYVHEFRQLCNLISISYCNCCFIWWPVSCMLHVFLKISSPFQSNWISDPLPFPQFICLQCLERLLCARGIGAFYCFKEQARNNCWVIAMKITVTAPAFMQHILSMLIISLARIQMANIIISMIQVDIIMIQMKGWD